LVIVTRPATGDRDPAAHEPRRRVQHDLGHRLDRGDHAHRDRDGRHADRAVAAHAEVARVVAEHDTQVGTRRTRRQQEGCDDRVVAARLEHQRAA
jgi:hypothetical protein